METIKINKAEECETIKVQLSKEKFPIAYQNKLKELVDCKAFDTQEEAEKWINENPIELELYYEIGSGLFAVEAEAVESCELQSPYTGIQLTE